MAPPEAGVLDICFADDITQIIIYPGHSRQRLARKTERAIQRVSDFEHRWKIRTNQNKFRLISISSREPHEVSMNGEPLQFDRNATVLGLTISRTGLSTHLTKRLQQAKAVRTKLKRFKKLKTKTKIHLYKALMRPVIEYPVVPICIASNSNIRKMQQYQNKSIRQATYNNPDDEEKQCKNCMINTK